MTFENVCIVLDTHTLYNHFKYINIYFVLTKCPNIKREQTAMNPASYECYLSIEILGKLCVYDYDH